MPAPDHDTLPVIVLGRFLDQAPVDLDAACRALGATVERKDLGSDVSGSIRRTRQGFAIQINASESHRRQRFTLAHEIAHLVLHGDLVGDGVTDSPLYRSRLSDDIERQANRYAASILMPTRLVRQAFRAGHTSPAAMAAVFDVSAKAAEIRMRDLELIDEINGLADTRA